MNIDPSILLSLLAEKQVECLQLRNEILKLREALNAANASNQGDDG